MAARQKTDAALASAMAELSAGNKKVTERMLAEKTGISTGAVHNWMVEQKARPKAPPVLSAKAVAQRENIRKGNPVRYGNNDGTEGSGNESASAGDDWTTPQGYAGGIEYEARSASDPAGGNPRGTSGGQRTDRIGHRRQGKPDRADERANLVNDSPAHRNERDGAGDLRGEGTIGDKLLKGAASFVEKTKENFQKQQQSDKPPKKPGKTLSDREADDLYEEYFQARRAVFNMMDDVIKWTTPGHKEPDIWNTIDDADLKIMVNAKLARAKYSVRAASEVRRTIEFYQRIAELVIVGPRLLQTIQLYQDLGFELPFKIRWPARKRRPRMTVVDADKTKAKASA